MTRPELIDVAEARGATHPSGPPPGTTGQAQLSELIDNARNRGRKFLELKDGTTLDNTGRDVVIEDKFTIVGETRHGCRVKVAQVPRDGSNNVLPAVYSGVYSCVKGISWEVAGYNPDPLPGDSPVPAVGAAGGRGVRLNSKAHWEDCDMYGWHAAFDLWGDHIDVINCETFSCFVALYRTNDPRPRGNLKLHRNRFTGCSLSAFLVDSGTEEDSLESVGNDYAANQYGWLAVPGGREFAFTNVLSVNDTFERNRHRHLCLGAPGALKRISGVFLEPRTGPLAGTADGFPDLPHGGMPDTWTLTPRDQDYAFTAYNLRGADAAGNDGLVEIQAAGGDTTNGPMLMGGYVGVFQHS